MAYFIGNSKSIRSSKNIQKIDNQSSRHQQSVNRVVEEKLFYKLKGIKKFEMRGMYYQNLNPDLNNPIGFYYSFPKNLIPSISNHLEKEKNWEKLLKLEKHQDLILDLSEKFKEVTLNRINIAKKILSNQNL